MIASIIMKAKEMDDKAGERAMNHIEKAFAQQTDERQANSGWTGSSAGSKAHPAKSQPVVVSIKKDDNEKQEEEKKSNDVESVVGNIIGEKTKNVGNDGASGSEGGSWINDVFNMIHKK